jgi:hypothetical protein
METVEGGGGSAIVAHLPKYSTEVTTVETDQELYPMPLFVKLWVRDVAESAKWYQEALVRLTR